MAPEVGSEASLYPDLFAPANWGFATATFRRGDRAPTDDVVANVNLVPYTPAGWVVLVLRDWRTEVAGGTREPGESVMEALRRELLEEAGAAIWLTCMGWLRRWWTVSGALILVHGGLILQLMVVQPDESPIRRERTALARRIYS